MQYALLIYNNPEVMEQLDPDELTALSAQFWGLRDDPQVVGGAHLTGVASATTLRAADGPALITDGPFADTKEVLSGFYMVEADDLDGALAIAARIPIDRIAGSVEVRAVVEAPSGRSYAASGQPAASGDAQA